jgi:hypothetical protein
MSHMIPAIGLAKILLWEALVGHPGFDTENLKSLTRVREFYCVLEKQKQLLMS